MTPAQHVGVALAQYKRMGIDFELAWIKSLRSLPKPSCEESRIQQKEWIDSIKWAKEEFRASYEGRPSPGTLSHRQQTQSVDVSGQSVLELAA